MHPDEAALLAAIHADPHDLGGWLVLADWLDDHADPRGELLRLVFALTRAYVPDRVAKEARMRRLIDNGVRPCVPVLTNSIGMELVLIPPGTFRMGSPLNEVERSDDETPHVVTLTQPFYVGRFPVTQAEYRVVTGQSPSEHADNGDPASRFFGVDTDRHPVENVTWHGAIAFCEALSALPDEVAAGRQYRLITEAEWEYAARAGTTTPFFTGESLPPDRANFDDRPRSTDGEPIEDRLGGTCRVDRYPPNAFGLYDLTGNAEEWCADVFAPYPDQPTTDPTPLSFERSGPDERHDAYTVVRGGHFADPPRFCRNAFRFMRYSDATFSRTGFRMALSVPRPS